MTPPASNPALNAMADALRPGYTWQVEIGTPDEDRPNCGKLAFAVECSPVASPAFQVRRYSRAGARLHL